MCLNVFVSRQNELLKIAISLFTLFLLLERDPRPHQEKDRSSCTANIYSVETFYKWIVGIITIDL